MFKTKKTKITRIAYVLFFLGSTTLRVVPSFALEGSLPDLVEKVGTFVMSFRIQILKTKGESGAKKDSFSQNSAYSTALGTGFIVLNEGSIEKNPKISHFLVLTNFHVVDGASAVEVVTLKNSVIPAKIVGKDSRNDIAVLRVEMPSETPILKIKSSKNLRVGEPLFAIGNPFGLSNTVTSGILSAKDRSLGVGAIDRYLQTNVAINFGNSGGPLFDYSGQVVGITTLAKSESQGLGFAIPSDTILKLLPRLAVGETLSRAWLGISVLPANKALVDYFKNELAPDQTQSVQMAIIGVHAQSPASKIGLKKGDLISAVFVKGVEQNLSTPFELREYLENLKPGDAVDLKVQRAPQKIFKAHLTLESAPEESEFYDFD